MLQIAISDTMPMSTLHEESFSLSSISCLSAHSGPTYYLEPKLLILVYHSLLQRSTLDKGSVRMFQDGGRYRFRRPCVYVLIWRGTNTPWPMMWAHISNRPWGSVKLMSYRMIAKRYASSFMEGRYHDFSCWNRCWCLLSQEEIEQWKTV